MAEELSSEHDNDGQVIDDDAQSSKFLPQLNVHNQMSRTQQKEDFQQMASEAFPGIKLDINKL